MIRYLKIKNWKAFSESEFYFDDNKINLIIGDNGSGKTTILEAISLALSGNILTSNYIDSIRDKNKPAQIDLLFTKNNDEYSVQRRFKSRKIAELLNKQDNSRITNWEDVSQKILELMDIDESFFSRLIYMSEGEVFRYLSDPPQDAINKRIQDIFGIENLTSLESYFQRKRRHFTSLTTEIKNTLKNVSEIREIDEKDINMLRKDSTKLRKKQNELKKTVNVVQGEIRKLNIERENLEKLIDLIVPLTRELQESNLINEGEEFNSETIYKAIHLLEDDIRVAEKEIKSLNIKIGSIQNRISYLNDIKKLLNSLSSLQDEKKSVPCPICKRPINMKMANRLINETEEEFKKAQNEIDKLNSEVSKQNSKLQRLVKEINSLREYKVRLEQFPDKFIKAIKPLSKVTIEAKKGDVIRQIEVLKEKLDDYNNSINKFQKEIESILEKIATAKVEIRQKKLKSELEERLISAYREELISKFVCSAIQSTLIQQRDKNLSQIYTQIALLWNRFRPESSWKVRFEIDGTMVLDGDRASIHFSNLSGGEKTVLLVLARVIICKMLSEVDFLMIDEPLEHLDIRNRRSLLNFLVQAIKKQIIPQLIVTTFEESLTRKYFEDENVNTILLKKKSF